MQERATEMTSPNDRSISALLADAISQLSKLISNEFDLARAEISEKLGHAAKGGVAIGAGALIMLPAMIIILIAAAKGLVAAGMSEPVAYLIVGLVTAALGAICIVVGKKQMTPEVLMPNRTLGQLKQDRDAVKEMVQ